MGEALHVLEVLFQQDGARLFFLQSLGLGDRIFLLGILPVLGSHLLACRARLVSRGFALGQFQHFLGGLLGNRSLVGDRTGDLAGGDLLSFLRLAGGRGGSGQLLPVGIPIGGLRANFPCRIALRHTYQLALVGQAQNLAGLDAVHVFSVELFGIGTV